MKIPESLYSQIIRMMPIACVDLLVANEADEILLVKRNNHPAKGHWWFPGGRIWFGETRRAAVRRKLKEECQLRAATITDLGTYDVILDRPDTGSISHGVTSLYQVGVENHQALCLDQQSCNAQWKAAPKWLKEQLHPFVEGRLIAYTQKS